MTVRTIGKTETVIPRRRRKKKSSWVHIAGRRNSSAASIPRVESSGSGASQILEQSWAVRIAYFLWSVNFPSVSYLSMITSTLSSCCQSFYIIERDRHYNPVRSTNNMSKSPAPRGEVTFEDKRRERDAIEAALRDTDEKIESLERLEITLKVSRRLPVNKQLCTINMYFS